MRKPEPSGSTMRGHSVIMLTIMIASLVVMPLLYQQHGGGQNQSLIHQASIPGGIMTEVYQSALPLSPQAVTGVTL